LKVQGQKNDWLQEDTEPDESLPSYDQATGYSVLEDIELMTPTTTAGQITCEADLPNVVPLDKRTHEEPTAAPLTPDEATALSLVRNEFNHVMTLPQSEALSRPIEGIIFNL
jgi:hypothetical protein